MPNDANDVSLNNWALSVSSRFALVAFLVFAQVTEISNVKNVTRLPRDTKRQAVAIVFTDDTSRTFTCESGTSPFTEACFAATFDEYT